MNRHVGALIITASLLYGVALPVHASDEECSMVMCLGGLVLGSGGGSKCSASIQKYFSIQVKKSGSFSESRTAQKRDQELKKCVGADPSVVSSIGDKFGSARGL